MYNFLITIQGTEGPIGKPGPQGDPGATGPMVSFLKGMRNGDGQLFR